VKKSDIKRAESELLAAKLRELKHRPEEFSFQLNEIDHAKMKIYMSEFGYDTVEEVILSNISTWFEAALEHHLGMKLHMEQLDKSKAAFVDFLAALKDEPNNGLPESFSSHIDELIDALSDKPVESETIKAPDTFNPEEFLRVEENEQDNT
jgi:hypothetical protein